MPQITKKDLTAKTHAAAEKVHTVCQDILYASSAWAAYEAWADLNAPQWVSFEGAKVFRCPGSGFVAVPATGRKNSRQWVILDLSDRSDWHVIGLSRKDAQQWLVNKVRYTEKEAEHLELRQRMTAVKVAARERLYGRLAA
jgi:hypothetical protein